MSGTRRLPSAEEYIDRLTRDCKRADPAGPLLRRARELLPVLEDLSREETNALADALDALARRIIYSVQGVSVALRHGREARHRLLARDTGAHGGNGGSR